MIRELEIHTKWYRKKIMRKICDRLAFKDKSGISISYREEKDGINAIFSIKMQSPDTYTKIAGFAGDFEEKENGNKTD